MYCDIASSAVLSSNQYSGPASQVQEAVGEYRSHQSTVACLFTDSVRHSLLIIPRLEDGTRRTALTLCHSLRVSKTLETFSAVRLGSGENREGRNW